MAGLSSTSHPRIVAVLWSAGWRLPRPVSSVVTGGKSWVNTLHSPRGVTILSPPPVMTRRRLLWPRTLPNHFFITFARENWHDYIVSKTRALGLLGKVTCHNDIQKTLRGIEKSEDCIDCDTRHGVITSLLTGVLCSYNWPPCVSVLVVWSVEGRPVPCYI